MEIACFAPAYMRGLIKAWCANTGIDAEYIEFTDSNNWEQKIMSEHGKLSYVEFPAADMDATKTFFTTVFMVVYFYKLNQVICLYFVR